MYFPCIWWYTSNVAFFFIYLRTKEIRSAGVQVYGKLIPQARRAACQQATENLNFITPWVDIPRILMSQGFQTFNWWLAQSAAP
jgi:hypothetical protein